MENKHPLEDALVEVHRPKATTFWLWEGGSKWFAMFVGLGIGYLISEPWEESYRWASEILGAIAGFVIGWRIDREDAARHEVRELLRKIGVRD